MCTEQSIAVHLPNPNARLTFKKVLLVQPILKSTNQTSVYNALVVN